MESGNLDVQDQAILISDDEETDTSYNEDMSTSEDNDSVIVISDDDMDHVSLSNYNLDCNSTLVSDPDSESEYIRITNRPGPKSRTRLKRPSQNSGSNKKIRTCNDGNKHDTSEFINLKDLIECDTDISSEDDLFMNSNTHNNQDILEESVGNKINLDKLNENEDVIDKKLITQAPVNSIPLEDDLDKNTDEHENKNDGDLHNSNKSISVNELIKHDIDILSEDDSFINTNTHNNKIISDISVENKISVEKLITIEGNIDNELISQVSVSDVSLDRDLNINSDGHEDNNDGDVHDSDKSIGLDELIKCDTDILDESGSNTNNVHNNKIISKVPLTNNGCLEKLIKNEDVIDNELIPQVPPCDISLEEDLDENTDGREDKNYGDKHDSDKLISLVKCDTDISGENQSNKNENINNKIISETITLNESIDNEVVPQKPLDNISHEEVLDDNTT